MPIYEYRCQSCGHPFERYATASGARADAGSCPRCGSPEVTKLFSTFAASCAGGGTAPSGGCGGGSSSFS